MTYSQCPFEPVVNGRGHEAVVFYKLMRRNLRLNWREMDQAITKSLNDSMTVGTGYMRVVLGDRE